MDSASSASPGCPVDIITNDALIIIFSFLTLYERLMVMRVNKRFHRILSNPQAWTHIDFWQEQEMRYCTWMFPKKEKAVLDFLKRYTSGSLKSIYLHVTSEKIRSHLQQTCGNLETISFLSANGKEHAVFDSEYTDSRLPHYHDCIILPVADSVRVYEIPLEGFDCYKCSHIQPAIQKSLMLRLGKCKNLRRLTITGIKAFFVTPEGWDALSQEITELNFLIKHIRSNTNSREICRALVALLKLTKVSSFRLNIETRGDGFNIDEFLCGIAEKWQDLTRLTLTGIHQPSSEISALVISALTQLQELELSGKMITDENMALIATHLKKLTSLKLTDGYYTASGIRDLYGHPSIERLYLVQEKDYSTNDEYVSAVYDVILSLPKIVYVQFTGYDVAERRNWKHIEEISPNVRIEVSQNRNYWSDWEPEPVWGF
ncbi:F-box/LRR-repeat protein 12-like [Amphiura filiformis]|uniref:F-box/LRR-repeat protein 12-like n=1 Tax=Amphiura filiformis TaxID=82378 RepID=UPI003B20CA90